MTKLNWDQHDGLNGAVWCADGDGIVAVYTNGDYFEIREQGDVIIVYKTIDEALYFAEQLLLNDYPAIYEDCLA